MDEANRKRKHQEKLVADATALSVLEENDGWKIVKDWIDTAIEGSKKKVFDEKKVKSWNDYLYYKAVYDTYTKLLDLMARRIREGTKAREELDSES